MNSDPRPDAEFSADRARLEAEAAGNTALPESTPANADAPVVPGKTNAEVERDILAAPRKTPADAMRDAIYAKSAANRGVTDESEDAMREGVQAMLEEPAPIHEGAPAARAPIDSPENTITLHVEGREIKVSRSDVEKAGIASLQKETNADFRVQRATLAEQAITARGAELDRREAEINASRATPTGATAPAARADLPSGGPEIDASTKQALEALLDSDVDGAARALNKIVADTAEAAVRRAVGNHQPAARAAPVVSEADRIWPAEARDSANLLVHAAYPELWENQALGQAFTTRLQEEIAKPVNLAARVDLGRLALMTAREVLSTRVAPSPQPASSSVQDELAARRTLAARVPGVPNSSGTRFVAPLDNGPAPKTRSNIVADMRKSRGQA